MPLDYPICYGKFIRLGWNCNFFVTCDDRLIMQLPKVTFQKASTQFSLWVSLILSQRLTTTWHEKKRRNTITNLFLRKQTTFPNWFLWAVHFTHSIQVSFFRQFFVCDLVSRCLFHFCSNFRGDYLLTAHQVLIEKTALKIQMSNTSTKLTSRQLDQRCYIDFYHSFWIIKVIGSQVSKYFNRFIIMSLRYILFLRFVSAVLHFGK